MKIISYSSIIFFIVVSDFLLHRAEAERHLKKKKKGKGKKFEGKKCKAKSKAKVPKRCKKVDTTYEPKIIAPAGSPNDPNFVAAANRCATALFMSGFSLFDFDRYGEWLDDSTGLYLKETGYYVGSESIAEYVLFLFSDLFDYYYSPKENAVLPLVADGDNCVITIAFVNTLNVKEYSSVAGGVSADAVTGLRTSFQITSPDLSTVKVDSIYAYYPPGFIGFLFNDAFDAELTARKNCNIMKTGCSNTFYKKNCYDEVQECIDEMMTLPNADGDNIDGKTLGCRTLHAGFAQVNYVHCPHMSFVPQYDTNCFLKCQKTTDNKLSDVFHPVELEFFDNYATSVGLVGGKQFTSPSIFGPPPQI